MSARLGRQVGLAVGLAIATAVIALVILVITVLSLERATTEARLHERVATRAQRVGSLIVDGETAVRGYTLTRDERFLEPLKIAQREMPVISGQLLMDTRTEQERRLADQLTTNASGYFVDYALPTIDLARRDDAEARRAIVSEAGKRRVDEIRMQVAALARVADAEAQRRQEQANARGDTARNVALVAALLIVLVLIVLQRRLHARVVRPVLEATSTAERIGEGDLTARVGMPYANNEVGRLARALNDMASRLESTADELEAQHTELESQNAELETQSVELEAQAAEIERRSDELADANDALQQRTVELETAGERLRESSERVRFYASVADRLAQAPEANERAETLLAALGDALDAPLGAVYLRHGDDSALRLAACRGLAELPATLDSNEQLAGRAVSERRTISASHPATQLTVRTLGAEAHVRHELHAPLIIRSDTEVVLGLLSLARTDDRPFDADERELVDHLAVSSALALFNALVSSQREQQAAMMRSVLSSVSEGIIVLGEGEEIILSNPAMDEFARRLIGLGPEEPWTVAQLRQAMDEAVLDREARASENEYFEQNPMAVHHADIELPQLGSWIHRYVAPVLGPDQELLGRIAVVRDITAERQSERAKDDLMATVSHELRTPLAAILGFAELLATRDFPDEERREYLETVHEQSKRLSALLDDFLDLQRLERRGLSEVQHTDLREVIDEQVRFYSAQSNAHEIGAVLDGEVLPVEGDVERLRRVLGNLLSNAIKYSPVGGPVRVEARRDDGVVRVAVVDRGLGIPETLRGRVFDRFFRVDSPATARIGGTGLGLALVRDIVHAHGGEVGVESVEGEGSRFWFTLPACD